MLGLPAETFAGGAAAVEQACYGHPTVALVQAAVAIDVPAVTVALVAKVYQVLS